MISALPRSRALSAAILILAGCLVGCVSVPADRGRSEVDAWVRERTRAADDAARESLAPETVAERVRDLLSRPLTPGISVRLALLGNPDLHATYARLDLAVADAYEAGRLANPRFSAAILDSNVAGEQLTLGVVLRFVDLLFLPSRARIGAARFAQAKQDVTHEVLQLTARAEESHYRLVAAQQLAAMRELASVAAGASAALAQRFHAAGNITGLERAREEAAASQARLETLAAQAELAEARARHARLLGLSAATHWSVEENLGAPLATEADVESLTALAQSSRLDLAAARSRTESLASLAGQTRRTHAIADLEVGVERERETDGERLTGPMIGFAVPVFGTGSDRSLRATAELERSRAALAGLELDVVHEVKLAHARTLNAKGRAEEFRSVLVPAREAIVARMQEEYNFMLAGQFELLAAKQAEYAAYSGYIESVRDYWLARTELARAVGTRLPDTPDGAIAPIAVPRPAEGRPDDEHRHHGTTGNDGTAGNDRTTGNDVATGGAP